MNERILDICIKAGINTWPFNEVGFISLDEGELEKFADLIRADEREALIRYFADHWRSDWTDVQIIEALEARGNK